MDERPGDRDNTVPADKLLSVIRDLIQELHARPPQVRLNSSLDRELGLDSLSLVELLARVESVFGVELPDEALADIQTPHDLLGLLSSRDRGASVAGTPAVAGVPLGTTGAGRGPPAHARTWPEVLEWHAQQDPTRLHLRLLLPGDKTEEMTYGQLWEAAGLMAQGLLDHGALPGNRIALMLPTGRDYFITFLGVLLAGCVPVPIYPPWRRSQLKDHLMRQGGILLNAGARLLITVAEARLLSRQLQLRVPSLRHVLTVEQVLSGVKQPARGSCAESDIALLQYTSGSTDVPKGVVLTHFNLLTNVRAMGAAANVNADDVFVSWLPLYHDMGLIGAWLGSLYFGMPLIVMPPTSFLRHPGRWLRAMGDYGGTISAAPNFGYELCLNRIDEEQVAGLDLGRWRLAFNGAEPVSPLTIRRFTERFATCGFRPEAMTPVYGLAESSLGVTFPPIGRGPVIDSVSREPFLRTGEAMPAAPDDSAPLRFVGCGRSLAGHRVRIVAGESVVQPERQQGRIQFKGPSATGGYFRNADATAELVADGWLETGDLGYLAGSELFVTGRSKEMIIRLGRNVHPQELEQAVGEIRGIRKGRTAVFGAADPGSGTERLVVLTETREQAPDRRAEINRQIVAASIDLLGMAPDDIVLADPGIVLKTSSGKIRRAACKELYEQGRLATAAKPFWRQIAELAVIGAVERLESLPRALAAALFAVYAWAVFGVLAFIAWALVALLPRIRLRWTVFRTIARLMLRIAGMGPVVHNDSQSIGTPCVVVANHSSMLDGLVLAAVLPQRLVFVAAGEFSDNWAAAIFLRRLGAVFVERRDRAKAAGAPQEVTELTRNGATVAFFPEGRMSRSPGLQPFRLGAFAVAAEAGVPVLPITIVGTESVLRGDSRIPRRGRVEVFVSSPLPPARGGWGGAVELRGRARAEILRHFREPDLDA